MHGAKKKKKPPEGENLSYTYKLRDRRHDVRLEKYFLVLCIPLASFGFNFISIIPFASLNSLLASFNQIELYLLNGLVN